MTALSFPEKADLTKPENISSLFVADGSFLRRNGIVIYDSLSKVFMNAAYDPGKLEVSLQGQPDINLSLLPGAGKEEVFVKGRLAPKSETLRDGLIRISPKP